MIYSICLLPHFSVSHKHVRTSLITKICNGCQNETLITVHKLLHRWPVIWEMEILLGWCKDHFSYRALNEFVENVNFIPSLQILLIIKHDHDNLVLILVEPCTNLLQCLTRSGIFWRETSNRFRVKMNSNMQSLLEPLNNLVETFQMYSACVTDSHRPIQPMNVELQHAYSHIHLITNREPLIGNLNCLMRLHKFHKERKIVLHDTIVVSQINVRIVSPQ
mmetsp:Transcript_5680/g.21419  ORF Transcript_5680/g.21419 Transcript_5680/m.21419 type:complete len:220 (-) Transcript_5680:431-1090(-)